MNTISYETRSLINRNKRQEQVRRNIIILLVLSVAIVAVSILVISFSSQANDMEHQPSYKYFKSVQIEKGDTLWSIAKENIDYTHYRNTSEYVKEVRKMNSLTSDNIIEGNYIIVPYYSSDFKNTQR
jgi:cell division protein YceG involved in septum cleavage